MIYTFQIKRMKRQYPWKEYCFVRADNSQNEGAIMFLHKKDSEYPYIKAFYPVGDDKWESTEEEFTQEEIWREF